MASKKSGFKPSNLLVWALLAMLVVGLGGFGVTNFGGGVTSIGSVGKTEINARTYGNALLQQQRTLSEQTGTDVTVEQMQALGIPQQVLRQQVDVAALAEAARLAGISAGDAAVAERVQSVANFQTSDGSFDTAAYRTALQRSGTSVAEFEDALRSEIAVTLIQRALLAGVSVPPAYGQAVLSYVAETRSVSWLTLTADDLPEPVATPTEAEVQAYYDANPVEFTLPERKRITYAWLAPEAMAADVQLTEDDLRAAYTARADEFDRPERRMISRLGFADMAAAEAAAAAISSGETSFAALVAERGLSLDDVDLGTASRDTLAPAVAEAVFGLDDTGTTAAVESEIGPALYKVNAILSAQITAFEDARDTIEADLRAQDAVRMVAEEAETLEDMLAGGATLEELVAETPMELGTLVWSPDAAMESLPVTLPEFQITAAAVSDDDFPTIEVAEDGTAFAMRVDTVLPEELQPLDAVRAEAEAGALAEKTRAALVTLAETDKAEIEAGAALDGFGDVATRSGLTRQRPPLDLPAPILEAVYDMTEAGALTIAEGTDEVYLMRLDAITPPDRSTAQAQSIIQGISEETLGQMQNDILAEIARSVAEAEGISLNQAAVNAVQSSLR